MTAKRKHAEAAIAERRRYMKDNDNEIDGAWNARRFQYFRRSIIRKLVNAINYGVSVADPSGKTFPIKRPS